MDRTPVKTARDLNYIKNMNRDLKKTETDHTKSRQTTISARRRSANSLQLRRSHGPPTKLMRKRPSAGCRRVCALVCLLIFLAFTSVNRLLETIKAQKGVFFFMGVAVQVKQEFVFRFVMSSKASSKQRHGSRRRNVTSLTGNAIDIGGGGDASISTASPQEPASSPIKERKVFTYQPSHWKLTWTPEIRTAFKLLLSARLCSVVWSHITDCDETFNYWEPLHYVLYHSGFQTWEYSPVFAIRSYAYILLHALPLKLYDLLFHPDRLLVFYILRLLFGFTSVCAESYFYDAVRRKFGPGVARFVLLIQLFAPGFFISTTAFLPSTFSMTMTTLAYALWFNDKDVFAVASIATSALLGWPFAAVFGIPIALDILYRRGLFTFTSQAATIGVSLSALIISIDSYFYNKLVFPTLNIVLYNVISGHGPELYGTDPWYFYVLNGFLNFNIVFFLALLSPLVAGVSYVLWGHQRIFVLPPRAWVYLGGTCLSLFIWLAILLSTPHKEERFLFPAYSLLALAGASVVEMVYRASQYFLEKFIERRTALKIVVTMSSVILGVFTILGVSRMFSLSTFYGAPMDVYVKLHPEALNRTRPASVCVGKEWHRFPSSFFLPDNFQLQFIQSDFKGILPKAFEPYPLGLSVIPTEMNDENREELGRYVDVCTCDYVVDLDIPGRESELEPRFIQKKSDWKVVHKEKFLDAEYSHRLYRAFYVPFLSEKYCTFGNYVLLKRRRQCRTEPRASEEI